MKQITQETITYTNRTGAPESGEVWSQAPAIYGGHSGATFVLREGSIALVAKRRGQGWAEVADLALWEGLVYRLLETGLTSRPRDHGRLWGSHRVTERKGPFIIAQCRVCADVISVRAPDSHRPDSRPACPCGGVAGVPPIGSGRPITTKGTVWDQSCTRY